MKSFVLGFLFLLIAMQVWTFLGYGNFLYEHHTGLIHFIFSILFFSTIFCFFYIKTWKGKVLDPSYLNKFEIALMVILFFYALGWGVYTKSLDIYGSVKNTDDGIFLEAARPRMITESELSFYDILKARFFLSVLIFVWSMTFLFLKYEKYLVNSKKILVSRKQIAKRKVMRSRHV